MKYRVRKMRRVERAYPEKNGAVLLNNANVNEEWGNLTKSTQSELLDSGAVVKVGEAEPPQQDAAVDAEPAEATTTDKED